MGFSGKVYFGSDPSNPAFTVDINSTAFSLFGNEVKWYGVLIGIGMVLAMLYTFKRAKSFGINVDKFIDVLLVGVIGGVIGARLYYVLFSLDEYAGKPFTDIFKIWEGGLGIYGGIIGAFLCGSLMCKIRHVKIAPVFDLAGMGFLIGQGIGRWGNFMNQEAFGDNTTMPWGMYSDGTYSYMNSLLQQGLKVDPTKPVHPCFLYESIWCLVGFLLIHIFSKKWKKYDGQLFLLYILWYGTGRFWIEGLRTDSLMMGPYRVSQFLAGLCVITSIILLIVFRKKDTIYGESGLEAEMIEDEKRIAEKKAKKEKKSVEEISDVEENSEIQDDKKEE